MKKLFDWLKRPKGFGIILIYILTCVSIAVSIIFACGLIAKYRYIGYIFYCLASILLCYSVYSIFYFVPKIKAKINNLIDKNNFLAKLKINYTFRTIIFAIISLAFSILYSFINGYIAVKEHSIWYGALALYYVVLVIARCSVFIFYQRKIQIDSNNLRHIKVYRNTGILLIILPFVLSIVILEVVKNNSAFVHIGFTIYVVAIYAFYKIIMSIINLVKARRNQNLLIQAIRNVNFADALVSILALQTAMFESFSTNSDTAVANGVTGAVVCFLTIILGINMLVNSKKKQKLIIEEQRNEKE